MRMKTRTAAIAACCGLIAALSGAAQAQTNYPEIEANDTKAAANPVGGAGGMVAGDTITGNTTGTSTTVAGAASSDNFLLKTAAAPLGIYRYDLALTTAGTAGHAGTLRGLTVATGGVVTPGSDAVLQTSTTTSVPARLNRWFGFGKQEEVYYRVTGTASTTANYVATLSRTAITPIAIAGVVAPGSVTIVPNAATQTAYDTDFFVYDSNFNVIGGADDPDTVGVTLNLTPGTYYVAAGNFNTATNFTAVAGTFLTGAATDFPNILTSTSGSSSATVWGLEFRAGGVTGSVLATGIGTARTTANPFAPDWFTFTVAVPVGPLPGSCVASPATVPFGSGSSVTLSTTVTPGTGSSTISSVTADLSAFGLSAVTALSNGGSGQDYSATFTVPSGQAPATYPIVITATDGVAATGLCNAALTITPPPPSNDDCASALNITSLPYTSPTTNLFQANDDVDVTCNATAAFATQKGVWFTYTPAANSNLALNNTTGPDTVTAIFTGDCNALTQVACSDPSSFTFPNAVGGTTYYILVGLWSGTTSTTNPNNLVFTLSQIVLGACCNNTTGVCTTTTLAACSTTTSTYLGDGTSCLAAPCPPSGSCCNDLTGACLLRVESLCVGTGLTWTSGGVCTPNPCPQPPPPANDECTAATILTLNVPGFGTITNSTGTDITSCSGSNIDVWFSFTPSTTGNYRVITTPTSTTDAGLAIAVFTDCPPAIDSNLPGTACVAQPGAGVISTAPFPGIGGTSYFIRAGGFVGNVGTFSIRVEQAILGACCSNTTGACTLVGPSSCLTGSTYQGDNSVCTPNPCPTPSACCFGSGVCVVTFATNCTSLGGTVNAAATCSPNPCGAVPANQTCAAAVPLALNNWVLGNNNLATGGATSPADTCQASSSKELWYTFTPATSDLFDFSACGSPVDTVVSVYTGIDCSTLTPFACDDDTCVGSEPSLIPGATASGFGSFIGQRSLTAGTIYYIRLSSFGTAAVGGNFQLRVAGNAPTSVVCCRGVTCAVVAAAACSAPAGVGIRVLGPAATSCAGQSAINAGCCYADFNKSGVKDVADIFAFLSAWFANSPFSDVGGDGTGTRDVSDIFQFLSAWFVGCT